MENIALLVIDVQNALVLAKPFAEKTNTTFDNGNISAKDLYEHYNSNIFSGRFGIVESIEDTIERIITWK